MTRTETKDPFHTKQELHCRYCAATTIGVPSELRGGCEFNLKGRNIWKWYANGIAGTGTIYALCPEDQSPRKIRESSEWATEQARMLAPNHRMLSENNSRNPDTGTTHEYTGHYRATMNSSHVTLPKELSAILNESPVLAADREGRYRFIVLFPKKISINPGSVTRDVRSNASRRITIPKKLREYAGIKGEVVFAGVKDFVEMWNPESLKKYCIEEIARGEDETTIACCRGLALSCD